jgi:iron complex outermembrane receptor protein
MIRTIRLLAAGTAVAALAAPLVAQTVPADTSGPAAAGPASGPSTATAPIGAAEIVVTASKRSERLQEVPVAITVVQGAQLARQNVVDIAGLTRTSPAFNIAGPYGAFSIRGVGSVSFSRSAEGSVGVVVDGVALANTSGNPPQLFDVQRIEVLAGPQGTLFGRNSSAGVLNIVTNDPDPSKFEARAHADIGTRNNQIVQAVVNIPTTATSALRISGAFTDSPHNQYNLYDGSWTQNEGKNIRARFKWEPIDRITFNLIGDYSRVDLQGGTPWTIYHDTPGSPIATRLAACGVVVDQDNDKGCTDGKTSQHDTAWGLSGQADFRFGDYTLTSISAFRHFSQAGVGQDADSIPINFINQNDSPTSINNFSQELRLTSPSHGLVTFVAGLYYFDSTISSANYQSGFPAGDIYGIPALSSIPVGQDTFTRSSLNSYAAFGEATVNLTSRLRLLGGLRVGHEQVDARTTHVLTGFAGYYTLPGPFSASVGDSYVSYKGGAQYDLSHAIMAYATYTRGYKGPSVNDQATTTAVALIVHPEIPHNIEGGIKTSLFAGRLTANLAVYHNRVTDFQAQFFDPTTAQYVFANAPKLVTKGISLDVAGRPIQSVTLNAGVLYNDARYGSGYVVQCSQQQTAAQGCTLPPPGVTSNRGTTDVGGRQLIGAPRWKVTASAEYHHAIGEKLEGYVAADVVYQSKIYFDAAYDPLDTVNGAALFGGKLGVRTQDERYGIAVFARNIFDKRLAVIRFETPTASADHDPSSYAQMFGDESFRTVGVSLDARF